jgi:hypothetical protein
MRSTAPGVSWYAKRLRRERFVNWFANLEPCLVATEACSAAHYWARKLRAPGHGVRLIPPQFVAPLSQGRRSRKERRTRCRSDVRCGEPSPHAFRAGQVTCAASVLVLHRMHTGSVEERTALMNRLRALLAEFGVFLPQAIGLLRRHFVDRVEDGSNELAGPARHALMRGWAQWQALDDEIAWLERQIAEHASQDAQAQRRLSGRHDVTFPGVTKRFRSASPTGRPVLSGDHWHLMTRSARSTGSVIRSPRDRAAIGQNHARRMADCNRPPGTVHSDRQAPRSYRSSVTTIYRPTFVVAMAVSKFLIRNPGIVTSPPICQGLRDRSRALTTGFFGQLTMPPRTGDSSPVRRSEMVSPSAHSRFAS